jgi:hypothetical protein
MKMQDQITKDMSALDAVHYDGGILDPLLSIGVWACVITGAFYLLKRARNPSAYCLFLASLTLISYTFREYQISLSLSMAKENAGVEPYDLLVDLWFVYRGSTLRFAAITFGFILATAFQIRKEPEQRVRETASTPDKW